jgi:hypothetical protein
MTARLQGSCYCRSVRYAVADEFVYAANCHCSSCRRRTGSAFKPFAGIEHKKFVIIDGRDQILTLGDANVHDARCGTCGSLLYSVVREGAFVHIPMGTLIDPPSLQPTQHIFVGDKASWHEITDNLPQYAAHAPDG